MRLSVQSAETAPPSPTSALKVGALPDFAVLTVGVIPQTESWISKRSHFQPSDVASSATEQGSSREKQGPSAKALAQVGSGNAGSRLPEAQLDTSASPPPHPRGPAGRAGRRAERRGGECGQGSAPAPPSARGRPGAAGWSRRPGAPRPGRVWLSRASPCSAPGLREMASRLSPAAPAIVSPGVA